MLRSRSRLALSVAAASLAVAAVACSSTPTDSTGASQADLAHAKSVSLSDVQKAIAAQGAQWTAGNTSMASLGRSDRLQKLGLSAAHTHVDHMAVLADDDALNEFKPLAAPAPIDWRNKSGKNYVSPILDQGRCGSCVAFSTIGTFETQLNIAAQDTASPFQLSPQYLFSCGGGACSFGWEPDSAAQFLVDTGVPDETCMPYTSGAHGDDATCSKACKTAKTSAIKAASYTSPTSGATNIDAVKAALQNGPLVTTLTVYDDFMYYTGGVYKHVTGPEDGGHAVSIVGYSDTDRAWIVRNSWGGDWGENGFIRVSWDDTSGVGDETWQLKINPPGPYVEANVRDHALFTGNQAVTFDAHQLPSGTTVAWTLTKSGKSMATGTSSDGATATIDTSKLTDGVYSLTPHATQPDGTKLTGESHVVYVLNGKETATIAYKTLTAGQTLSGIAEFDITVAASPVPLTSVTWNVTDSSGKVIVTRTTENTGKLMQLAWNTSRWPNGSYTISVAGAAGTQNLAPKTINVTVKN